MHRLSIVIPCPVFNQSAEDTLVSVLQNRPADCEVIVVTAGKYDDPYELDGEVNFVEESKNASLTQLANRGFDSASAEVVHLLQPGMQAVEDWTEPVLGHFDDPQVGAVSPAIVANATSTRAQSLGVAYRSCGIRRVIGKGAKLTDPRIAHSSVLGPSFDAGFYRRVLLTALGGFDERMGATYADVELALVLRQLGYHTIVEPASILVRGNVDLRTSSFQKARQAERLYRRYSTHGPGSVVLHTLVAAADLLCKFPRPQMLTHACGRLAAWFESGIQEQCQERVHRAQAHLARATVSQAPTSIRGDFSKGRGKQPAAVKAPLRRRAA